jgi:hypothetical protein
MLLKLRDKQAIECKIAKFIKMPFMNLEGLESLEWGAYINKPLPTYSIKYTVMHSIHQTIFYTKNNIVYSHKSILSSSSKRIIPLYNYKKETYHLVKLDYPDIGSKNLLINHFKASNGDIYFVFISLAKRDNNSERETVVYNYTKNKIVYREERQPQDEVTFKIPIANSLIVSLLQKGSDIWIKIIDVTKEKEDGSAYIEALHFSLAQYFMNVIGLLSDRISKNEIGNLNRIVHDIVNKNIVSDSIEYDWSPDAAITVGIDDNDTVFYKDFQIQVHTINLESLKAVIDKAFSFSFIFENNKIVIRLGTGREGYIKIKQHTIKIPSDNFWVIGEYVITDRHDLSKSHLYSVEKVSKEYIIINSAIYYPDRQIPKIYKGYSIKNSIEHIYDYGDFSILKSTFGIFKNKADFAAFLNLTSSKIDYRTAIQVIEKADSCSYPYNAIKIININQVRNDIVQIYKENGDKTPEIIELPKNSVKTVNINKIVLRFLSKIYKTQIQNNSYICTYYIDNEKGHLYYLVLYTDIFDDQNIILFKYYLVGKNKLPEIVAHAKIRHDEQQKSSNFLEVIKAKIINLMAFHRSNLLYLAQPLEPYQNIYSYNHLNDLIIKAGYSMFQINDIRHNRTKEIKYEGKTGNVKFTVRDIERRYNTVIFKIKLRVSGREIYIIVPLVVLNLTVTKKLSLGL